DEEDLVGGVELIASDRALDDRDAELGEDRERRVSGDAAEDRAPEGGRRHLAVADDEDVLARGLADVALRVEHDGFVVAGREDLALREDRVDVVADDLALRHEAVDARALEGADLGADALLQ